MKIDFDGEQWWLCWICRGFADRNRGSASGQPVLSKHESLLKARFSKIKLSGSISEMLYRPYDEEASFAELGHGQRGLVCAAAILQEGNVFRSALDTLSDEEHVLCDLLDGLRGSTFMRVNALVPLANPQPAVAAGQAAGHLREAFTLTPECIQRCLSAQAAQPTLVPCNAASQPDVVREELLFKCFATIGVFPQTLDACMDTALQVPSGLCELLCKGLWETCGLSPKSRRSMDCSLYPLRDHVRARAAEITSDGKGSTVKLACDSIPLNNHMYTALAQDLRKWSEAIIREHGSDSDVDIESQVHSYILWLDSMHEATAPRAFVSHTWQACKKNQPGGALNRTLGQRGRYATCFLLQTVMFAMHLRNSAALSLALQKAFSMLPPVWRGALQDMLSQALLPSPATISRSKLFIDVTFMLFMRTRVADLLKEGSCFYLLLDSSPQGNQNWEMMEWCGVRGSCLQEVFRVFQDQMKLSSVQPSDLTRDQLQEAAACLDVIRNGQLHHVLPPVALGIRRASLLDKVHAVLHGLRLECSSFADVQLLLQHTSSVTADLGTEAELSQVEINVGSMFPYWSDSSGVSTFELSEDAGAVEPEPTGSAEPAVAVGAPSTNTVSFRSCLFVPGLFNILDGATHTLLNSSEIWPEVKPLYESTVRFFHHAHYRRFFTSCCLSDPATHGWAFLFNDGPPLFEGGRAWGGGTGACVEVFIDSCKAFQARCKCKGRCRG